jgi:hypothetical protein
MSTFYSYQSGLHNVGSFQVSSIPWASASIAVAPLTEPPTASVTALGPVTEIEFWKVSKFVIVKNEIAVDDIPKPIRLGFSVLGIKEDNYILLENDESFSADYKITRLYLMANQTASTSASVYAGLTGIPEGRLTHNWSGSAGVG